MWLLFVLFPPDLLLLDLLITVGYYILFVYVTPKSSWINHKSSSTFFFFFKILASFSCTFLQYGGPRTYDMLSPIENCNGMWNVVFLFWFEGTDGWDVDDDLILSFFLSVKTSLTGKTKLRQNRMANGFFQFKKYLKKAEHFFSSHNNDDDDDDERL